MAAKKPAKKSAIKRTVTPIKAATKSDATAAALRVKRRADELSDAVRLVIAAERKRLSLTYRQADALCGLSRNIIYKIEHGRVAVSLLQLLAIELGFALPLGSIVARAVSPPTPAVSPPTPAVVPAPVAPEGASGEQR